MILIKSRDVVRVLELLRVQAQESERCYRNALTCITQAHTTVRFIHFWQEHARIVADLEQRVLRFGGVLEEKREASWGRLIFNENAQPEDIDRALEQCLRQDSDTI